MEYGCRMTMEDGASEWSPAAIALGTRVTRERERLGLTKEALGQRTGLASRYLWRVEAGRQNIQLGNIVKLADGLGLTLAELMTGVEDLMKSPEPKAEVKPRGVKASRASKEA